MSTPLFETKVAIYGPRLMRDFKITAVQAAGVLGNGGYESVGFTTLQEIKPVVAGSRGGWGWFQWTGPRRRAMEAWCTAHHLDPSSDEANYGYLCFELGGTEANALKALRRQNTLEGATQSFCETFERPGVVAMKGRLAYARRALAVLDAARPLPANDNAPVTPPVTAPKPGGLFAGLLAWLRRA